MHAARAITDSRQGMEREHKGFCPSAMSTGNQDIKDIDQSRAVGEGQFTGRQTAG